MILSYGINFSIFIDQIQIFVLFIVKRSYAQYGGLKMSHERRKNNRMPIYPVRAEITDDIETYEVYLDDISEEGSKVWTIKSIENVDQYSLTITPNRFHLPPIKLLAETKWNSNGDNGNKSLGCQFINVTQNQKKDLQNLSEMLDKENIRLNGKKKK